MLNTMVWKLRKSCFQGPNIDDCKVSSRIHSCIYASISYKNCYEKGKFV